MSLTRKHFIELAEIFKQQEPIEPKTRNEVEVARYRVWMQLRERIAEFCAEQNSSFDYERFMKASENDY